MTDASQEKNQDPMQEQEMEEEQQLDEEEDINGPADERKEEVVEYHKLRSFHSRLHRFSSNV